MDPCISWVCTEAEGSSTGLQCLLPVPIAAWAGAMACMHGTAARLTRPSHLLLLPHAGSADVYQTGSNCTGKHQSSSTGATHQAQPCLLLWPQLLLEGVRAKLNPRDLLVLEPPWEGAYGVGVPTLVAEKLVMLQLCCHLVQRGLHTKEAHMWGSGCTTIPTQMLPGPGSACQHWAGCDSLTRLCQSVQCGKRQSKMAVDILKGACEWRNTSEHRVLLHPLGLAQHTQCAAATCQSGAPACCKQPQRCCNTLHGKVAGTRHLS